MATKNKDVSAKMAAVKTATEAVTASPDAKRGPIKTFWEEDVGVAIWARVRQTKDGPLTFYSVTFERSWRDDKGQFHYTDSFNFEDMPQDFAVGKVRSGVRGASPVP